MQRKPFWKVFLIGLGYMVLGNLMCLILTVSTVPFTSINVAFTVVLFVLTTFVFYALMFTGGYKDGVKERSMLQYDRVDGPTNRWLLVGVLLFGIMCIPSIVQLFLNYTIVYRFLCGAIYPLAQLMGVKDYTEAWQVLVFIAYYALMPLALHLGYRTGISGKFSGGNFMYEK